MRIYANFKTLPKEMQLDKKLLIEVYTMTQPRVEIIDCDDDEVYIMEKSAGGLKKQSSGSTNMRMPN